MNIVLIGFMGSGKTAVGRALADNQGLNFIDTDSEIEKNLDLSVKEIFHGHGESHFRSIESKIIKEISEITGNVISCGGGVVLNPENIELLKKNGKLIWLDASAETIIGRVDIDKRPLLQGKDPEGTIKNLLAGRRNLYESAADMVVNTDGRSIGQIAENIQDLIRKERGN